MKYLANKELYEEIILKIVPQTKNFLWIATSDIKDMYVESANNNFIPFLEILAKLIKNGVNVRIIHAKEPGKNFSDDFDKYPILAEGLEMLLCPRVHLKLIVSDGKYAYSGSANLTGAGLGSKSNSTRNFESGFLFDEQEIIEKIMNQFDSIWIGKECLNCNRKKFCASYGDLI